jgi:hypothetical protein
VQGANSPPRIVEVDESQHFNCYRGKTLRLYPAELQLAFDRQTWIERSRFPPLALQESDTAAVGDADQLDGRISAAKLFDQLITDIEADLGGRDQASTIERALVEVFAGAAVLLYDLNTNIAFKDPPRKHWSWLEHIVPTARAHQGDRIFTLPAPINLVASSVHQRRRTAPKTHPLF